MPLQSVGTSPFESGLNSSMVATVTSADPVLSEAIPGYQVATPYPLSTRNASNIPY